MAKVEILSKSLRPVGMIQTPSYYIPTTVKPPLEFHALIDDKEYDDPEFVLKMDIDISADGIHWQYWGGIEFLGGVETPPGMPKGMPGMGVSNIENIRGKYTRQRVYKNKSANLGIEIEDEAGGPPGGIRTG